jgi:hypothetical protein
MPLSPPGPTAPGLYPGGGQAVLLRTNEQQYLLKGQQISVGQSSIAVQLERIKAAAYPFAVSFQVWFTDVNGNPSNPGTFEVDLQASDLDTDTQYSSEGGGGLTSLNANFSGRIELPFIWARFVRANVVTLANPVYIWVLATR